MGRAGGAGAGETAALSLAVASSSPSSTRTPSRQGPPTDLSAAFYDEGEANEGIFGSGGGASLTPKRGPPPSMSMSPSLSLSMSGDDGDERESRPGRIPETGMHGHGTGATSTTGDAHYRGY